jgi:hypothetical protein
MNSSIYVHQEAFNTIIFGVELLPKMSNDFPAEQINTSRSWTDLILPQNTLNELQTIEAWYNSSRILMEDWGCRKSLNLVLECCFTEIREQGKLLQPAF